MVTLKESLPVHISIVADELILIPMPLVFIQDFCRKKNMTFFCNTMIARPLHILQTIENCFTILM